MTENLWVKFSSSTAKVSKLDLLPSRLKNKDEKQEFVSSGFLSNSLLKSVTVSNPEQFWRISDYFLIISAVSVNSSS